MNALFEECGDRSDIVDPSSRSSTVSKECAHRHVINIRFSTSKPHMHSMEFSSYYSWCKKCTSKESFSASKGVKIYTSDQNYNIHFPHRL